MRLAVTVLLACVLLAFLPWPLALAAGYFCLRRPRRH